MKLGLINGSPRGRKSNSDRILGWLTSGISNTVSLEKVYAADIKKYDENLKKLEDCDYFVFIFPLYTDSMPGTSKAFIEEMELIKNVFSEKPIVFIIHSGFPESSQSKTVKRYVQYFSKLMNMNYTGCVLMGGSEALQVAPDKYFGGKAEAFKKLGENIAKLQELDSKAIGEIYGKESIGKIQSFLLNYTRISNFYWNRTLKKNGVFDKRYDKPYSK